MIDPTGSFCPLIRETCKENDCVMFVPDALKGDRIVDACLWATAIERQAAIATQGELDAKNFPRRPADE